MKVLMVVDAWFPHTGGGQVHAWELSKALADKGHQVTVLTRNNGPWEGSYPGVSVKRLGRARDFADLGARLTFLVAVYMRVLLTDCDIIHLHAFSPGLLAPFLRIKRKPIVFTVHGGGMKVAGLSFAGKFLEDLVFYKIKYNAEITVAKQTLAKDTVTKKIVVIPNGVNLEDWKGAQRSRKEVRHLIYVGRLVFDKGVDLLIEAFKSLDNKKLDLTIVGEGPEMGNLKKIAKGQRIRFTGKLEGNDLVKELRKADLYIMPSRVEGMPIRLLEGWAAKVPVVATRVGDNEKYVKDRQSGFLADVDANSINESICRAVEAENLADIVEFSYKRVQSFTWSRVADRTLKIYKEVLDDETKS